MDIADYLADREGLRGAAREIFLRILRNIFGFSVARPRWLTFATSVYLAAVTWMGVSLEVQERASGIFISLWIAITGLGVGLAFAVSAAVRRPPAVSKEIEWRAYCLLVRPLILAKKPGLLDRNLGVDIGAEEPRINTKPELPTLLLGSPIDLWLSAYAGWGIGTAAVVIWHHTVERSAWCFLMPVVGAVVAPFFWCIGRKAIFVRMERVVRKLD